METEKEGIRKIDLDTILVEEIGEFGRFQLRTCILAAIVGIFVAISGNGYVFTTGRINSRCFIPECDGDEPEWNPGWLEYAIPTTDSDSYDNCHRFGNVTILPHLVENDTCPSSLFDINTLLECDTYVYENKDTITYEFDLACNEWARTLVGTIRSVGSLLALPIVGYISDRWGRRVALCITTFNTAWIGLVRYWANSYISYVILEFMEDLFGSGNFTSAYILLIELLGPRFRIGAGAAMSSFFSLGLILMSLTAWVLRNWRHLILAFYIPQLFTIFYYFMISESVRWYVSKGRFAESEALLKKAAKVNGRQLSEKSLEGLRHNAMEELARKNDLEKEATEGEWLIVTIFKHKRVLMYCVISSIWFITMMFVSYGLGINAVNMSGNQYLNFMAVAAVEIPGHWFSVFLLTKMGRKPVLILSFWCCTASQLAFIFMPKGYYGLSLSAYLLAQFCIAAVTAAVHVYTAELYPTTHRQVLFSVTTMIGKIGSVIAPLTPAFGAEWFEDLPFVLFATMALLSGALVFLTPETRGVKLADTFEQAMTIGRNGNENINQQTSKEF